MQLEQKSQDQQFKIPQTIQNHKQQLLYPKIISTLTGIDIKRTLQTPLILLPLIGVIATFIILKFIPNVQYGVCIGVNIGICFIAGIVFNLIASQPHTVHKLIFSCIFGYLWSHQLFYSSEAQLIVLTLISIITSIYPVIFSPVTQFTSPTLYLTQFSIHSVRYMRLLLPLPFFIIQLVWDYGKFFSQTTNHYYYLRLSISLVFLTWMFGLISTLYNTFFFLLNNINKFLFGDQTKSNFTILIVSLIMNCIPIAIYLGWAQGSSYPYWILWIGSTIKSIGTFLVNYFINDKFQNKSFGIRNILMITFESLICGGLLALLICVDFSSYISSIKIITIIDVALYVLFAIVRFLSLPRNWLGLAFNIQKFNNQYFRALQKIILRISAGFTVIILIQNLTAFQLWTKLSQTLNFNVDLKFVQYFFIPFLVYRSYKRSLSQSTSFGFHLSVLISLGLIFTDRQLQSILVVLFFPPFPHNFIMTFIAPFTTPKKLSHKNQTLYQLLYLTITCLATVLMVLSIGMLQFTMFFGLPVFMCVLPTINQGNKIKSKEHSLYQKIVQYIPQQLFRFQKQGFYLIRISKYIILAEIKQQNYGFGQIVDLKGLEVQQVTSCHSKQGQTIDKMVEQTWGDAKDCLNISNTWTVLSPLNKSLIHVPTQNQIQLTGIIESQQFLELFKKATLKSLIHQMSKIKLSQKQITQGEQIVSDLSPICKKQKFQNIFPTQFAKQVGLQFQYPDFSSRNVQVKKKLPPLKNKKETSNDFMDLLDSSSPKFTSTIKGQTSTHQLNSGIKQEQQNPEPQTIKKQSQKLNTIVLNSLKIKEINVALIMTLYHFSVGKFDYFNVKKMYDLIKMEKGELNQVTFQQSQSILSRALSKAFKITIDKTTMAQTDIDLSDLQDYDKNAFLGVTGSESYNQAVGRDLQDIWTLNYSKSKLSIKRLAKSQNQLYLFKADACIVKATWNNLRYQLIYATNDNDQRYSIQTHPYLMRNLWTQACEQPFGYSSFHSGNLLNT